MLNERIVIGIDPDVKMSGYSIYNSSVNELLLFEYDLSDLFIQLIKQKFVCQKDKIDLKVRLEAGHIVKKTWGRRTVGAVKDVGRNNEIGAQIEKFLIKHNIRHELIEPCGLSNVKHDQFCNITKWDKKKATNPEKRVAGLLAYKR